MDKPDNNDPVPRDVIAMVVLHALLTGVRINDLPKDGLVAAANGAANIAYAFADAMVERGEDPE